MTLILWAALMALLAACGDEGNGNDDTLFTGFSGLVIVAVAAFFIFRAMKKRG